MPPQSHLNWAYEALGLTYTVAMLLAGLVCFGVVLFLVRRGRGPMAAAALVLVVPVPLWIGLLAMAHGLCSSYWVLARSATAPHLSALYDSYSTALVAPIVGLLVTLPAFMCAVIGATVRATSTIADTG